MLIASTVTAVSEPELLSVGHKPVQPLYVRFDRADSTTINLCEISRRPDIDPKDPASGKAVELNSLDTVLETFTFFCESPDRSSVVFEASSFFSGDNARLGPVKSGTSNLVSTKYTLKKNSPIIEGVKAFSDNVSIVSRYTYTVNSDIMGLATIRKDQPYTVRTTRSILLLPEEKMTPRIADSRVGIFLSNRSALSTDEDNIRTEWMPDSMDKDCSLRQSRYEQLAKQYSRYIGNVIMNIGGIYLYPSGAEDTPKAVPVPKEIQRESLKWVIREIRGSSWLSEQSLTEKFPLAVGKARILQFNAASDLFATYNNVILSSHVAAPDEAYSLQDWLDDISKEIFGKGSGKPDEALMTLQKVYIATLISGADKRVSTSKQTLLSDGEDEQSFGKAGYNWQSRLNIKVINNSRELFFGELNRLHDTIKTYAQFARNREQESHFLELQRQIDEVLENK